MDVEKAKELKAIAEQSDKLERVQVLEVAMSTLEPAESVGKPFRIQNKMLHLTYATHIDFNEWLSFAAELASKSKKREIEEYSMVHENGDSKVPYPHTHILVKYADTFDSKSSRVLDFKGIHPHIEKVLTPDHWANSIEYHTKEGVPFTSLKALPEKKTKCEKKERVRDVGPGGFADKVWNYDTIPDAIMHLCGSSREVGGVIACFNYKPIDYGAELEMQWRPWQTQLFKEFEEETDDRTINWIWDPMGHCGKTTFARHMFMYRSGYLTTVTTLRDVSTALQAAFKQKSSYLAIMLNITKSDSESKDGKKAIKDIYNTLECIKDRVMSSGKYVGKTTVHDPVHVVVFANGPPDIYKMVLDRWRIRTIDGGMTFKHDFNGYMMDERLKEYKKLFHFSDEAALNYYAECIEGDLTPAPVTVKPLEKPVMPSFTPNKTPRTPIIYTSGTPVVQTPRTPIIYASGAPVVQTPRSPLVPPVPTIPQVPMVPMVPMLPPVPVVPPPTVPMVPPVPTTIPLSTYLTNQPIKDPQVPPFSLTPPPIHLTSYRLPTIPSLFVVPNTPPKMERHPGGFSVAPTPVMRGLQNR